MENKPKIEITDPCVETELTLRFLCVAFGLVGFPRQADVAVLRLMMQRDPQADLITAQEEAANYVWDHLLGEPDGLQVSDMLDKYRAIREVFLG